MSNSVSPFVVRITDEFNCVYQLEANNKDQVIKTVKDWLNNLDSTPIYEIAIEINND